MGCSAPPRGWHTKPPGKGLDLGPCSAPKGAGAAGIPQGGPGSAGSPALSTPSREVPSPCHPRLHPTPPHGEL